MIYGLIPIGGKGTRLSLPYSKEMLPQKNFNYFNPVVNHVVDKMQSAGAEKIVFVHGLEFKQDVKQYFNKHNHTHILQHKLGVTTILLDFYKQLDPANHDTVLFGLPDTVFDGNPFVEMVTIPGIVCGLFTTNDQSQVDRLDIDGKTFQVKTKKTPTNQNLFWGVLKFNVTDICAMIDQSVFDHPTELGNVLNQHKKSLICGGAYLDLGTWENYNQYLVGTNNFSND
jgi:glucose-1-phosphate thymidylyltransferase